MRGVLWAIAVAGFIGAVPRICAACSPRCEDPEILPNESSKDVPVNTRIWLLGKLRYMNHAECEAQGEPRLETSDGTVVPTQRSRVPNGITLTPTEPLVIGQRYRVRARCLRDRDGDAEFTVAADRDESPPAPPVVDIGKLHAGADECTSWRYRAARESGGGPLYMVRNEFGGPSLTPSLGVLGKDFCSNVAWPPDETRVDYEFAAVDFAGNQSPWTQPVTVSLFGCGCTANASDGRSFARPWLLGLCVFFGLRRRRERSADMA